jgi:hypothetical protein
MPRRAFLFLPAFWRRRTSESASVQFDSEAWPEFVPIWNVFASEMNSGVFDQKTWQRVREHFHRVERCSCK